MGNLLWINKVPIHPCEQLKIIHKVINIHKPVGVQGKVHQKETLRIPYLEEDYKRLN